MSLRFSTGLALLAMIVAVTTARAQQPQPFDVLISGGQVIDGTGNPWFYADVGIRGGRVVAVGKLAGVQARRVIDARGKVVTPGFIDIHSHAAEGLASDDVRRRRAPDIVTQGVTTVAVNPDGDGPLSIAGQRATFERLGIGVNAILMVPHNTIRRAVLGETTSAKPRRRRSTGCAP